MSYFLKAGAYILHPLMMPILGAAIYFYITPRFIEDDVVASKLFAIAIVSILIPIVFFFLLRNIGWVKSIQLKEVHERKIPLMIQCLLMLLLIKMVFDPYDNPELYFFFVGILFSTISAVILVLFKIKSSLHQMGIAGVTMFVIALSIHFKVNLLIAIGLLLICNGWVASSRLDSEAHTIPELIVGFFLGIIPQLLVLNLWL